MNNDTQFLAPGHSLKKISSKISSLQATKKIKQHCYLSISGPRPFFKKDFLQDFQPSGYKRISWSIGNCLWQEIFGGNLNKDIVYARNKERRQNEKR